LILAEQDVRGDCSIRTEGLGFSAEEIAACAQRQGLLSLELELSTSNECACASCQSDSESVRQVLSLDEIRDLIGQGVALGVRRVILVDDDTASYPHLQQLIQDLRTAQLDVELFTDGVGMTPNVAQFLHNSDVSVALRLDARDGRYGAADSPSLSALAHAGYGGANGPRLAVRIPVLSGNIEEIPTTWRWARSNGIEPLVQIITPRRAPGEEPQFIEPDRARRLFEELGRIDQEEFGRSWELPPSLTGRSCKRHLFACHVTACGTIFACVGVTIPLGNIRTELLREILGLSEVMENLRAFGEKVKEPCRTCCKSTDCYGCRGAVYQLTGDYLAGDQLCWKAASTRIPTLPVSVSDLVPHGPSIRMIDRLVQVGERKAWTDFTVAPESIWVDAAGRLDELAYVEMIAQSFAASHGFHLSDEERLVHRGLLLGVKDLVISGEARVGDRLRILLRKVTRFGDFGIVEGEVRHQNGTLVAMGQIKIWRPNDEAMKAMIP
jgi:predicted hotdog family 3-hydroxylacyl-ACP dehydratase/MoaA/NifB/PqqE/SkfB family radical SAM enzyme